MSSALGSDNNHGIKSEEAENDPSQGSQLDPQGIPFGIPAPAHNFEGELDEFIDAELDDIEELQTGSTYYTDEGFVIRQIPDARIRLCGLRELYILSQGPYLKLDPEYQRDVVWDEHRASALIASILQGYYIPPVLFNLEPTEQFIDNGLGRRMRRYRRICIDGKQRLTSVFKFMRGEIGVPDSSSPPKKWYYCHPMVDGVEQVSNRNILPDTTKRFFSERKFCCYEYDELPATIEENMFQLVQRGIPLTPAERLRAMSTDWAKYAKTYEQDYALVINLSKQSRASGFRAVVTIFCELLEVMNPSGTKRGMIDMVRLNPTLQSSPHVLVKFLQSTVSPDEAVQAEFREVFDRYLELAKLSFTTAGPGKVSKILQNSAFDPTAKYLTHPEVSHVKTFSPLELLATAVLIYKHGKTSTNKQLIQDIKQMRYYLRQQHKDLRLNNICWITAWNFINTELIKRRGAEGNEPRRRMAVGIAGEVWEEGVPRGGRAIRGGRRARGGAAAQSAPRYFAPTSGNLSVDQGQIREPSPLYDMASDDLPDLNGDASPSVASPPESVDDGPSRGASSDWEPPRKRTRTSD